MQFRTPTLEETIETNFWKNHFESNYKFTFFQPSFDRVPFVSNLFKDEKVIEPFQEIENYLLLTYPIYKGTNCFHEMHNIKKMFSKEIYFEDKKLNKLGINRWGTIIQPLVFGLRNLDIEILRFKELDGYFNSFYKIYGNLEFNDKLVKIRKLDKLIYNVLEKVYEKYS